MKAFVEEWNAPEAVANTLGRHQGSWGKGRDLGFRVTVTQLCGSSEPNTSMPITQALKIAKACVA